MYTSYSTIIMTFYEHGVKAVYGSMTIMIGKKCKHNMKLRKLLASYSSSVNY